MTDHPIEVSQAGAVAWIRFNNPATRNALSLAMVSALGEALEAAISDNDTACIILGGADGTFCSGLDLKESANATEHVYLALTSALQAATTLIFDSHKPVIAAMDGYAIGGGLELTLACDIRVASDRMQAWMPEVRLGVSMTNASSVLLPLIVGASQANRMVLLEEHVSAERALAVGLVDEVVDHHELDARAVEIAHVLADRSAEALGSARRLMRAAVQQQVEQALQTEMQYTRTLLPQRTGRI